jgi:hypothetical protein
MKEKFLTDAMVEQQIIELANDPHVQLARAETREKYRRRQYLYQLRWLKKRGVELERQGWIPKCDEELDDDER